MSAVDITTGKIGVLQFLQNRYLHFEDSFLVVPSFKFDGYGILARDIYSTVDLPKSTLSNLLV